MDLESEELLIRMQPTPNPQALKYVMNKPVKLEGKATYHSLEEASQNVLAYSLMQIPGAEQTHMFENIITLTFADGSDPYDRVDDVIAIIKSRYPAHNPAFTVEGEKKQKRETRSPEIQKIEEILDRTIRPGLQADGGDLEIVSLKEKYLEIRYEGACGTCPSATMGTLQAIEGILQNEYDPDLIILLADSVY